VKRSSQLTPSSSCPSPGPHSYLALDIAQTHPSLSRIIGGFPNFVLLLSSLEASQSPFFHGSCAYLDNELYITSDLLQPTDSSQPPVILISRVRLGRRLTSSDIKEVEWSKLRPPPEMPMPAGAVASRDSIHYCSMGNLTQGSSSGVAHMSKGKPPFKLVNNFFGTHFGTVCALALDPTADWGPDGHENHAIWFVDAGNRGYEAGFRPPARMPPMIWRYNITHGDLRAMTDEIRSPWDITFSPDGQTLYVTESDPGRTEREAGWNR
jgi:gluconolactonase